MESFLFSTQHYFHGYRFYLFSQYFKIIKERSIVIEKQA